MTTSIQPILNSIGNFFGYTMDKTIDTTATGAKVGVDVSAGVLKDVVNLGRVDNKPSPEASKETDTEDDVKNELTKDINETPFVHKPPKPTESTHIIQRGRNVTKKGYCYIGEDRGFRSCTRVRPGDQCMSGEVFPTMDVCVNPSLRV